MVELAGGRVERRCATSFPGHVARAFDRLDEQLDGVLVVLEVGGEAALVALTRWTAPSALRTARRAWKRLAPRAERLGEGGRPDGHEHELLEVDRVVGHGRRR